MNTRRLLASFVFLAMMLSLGLSPALAQDAFQLETDHRAQGMGRTWRQGYVPQVAGDSMVFHLPLRSTVAQGGISARFVVERELGSPFVDSQVTARFTGQNGLYVLRFTLPLHKDRQMGVYPCRVEVEGKDAGGKTITGVFPVNITLSEGAPREEAMPLRITRVDAKDLQPGKQGMLHALLENTSTAQRIRGISIRVSDPAGEILPAGADTLYRELLEPGEAWQVEMPLVVLAAAAARPHQLLLRVHYADMAGKEQELSEHHTLRVSHQVALHHGAPSFPQQVVQQSVNDYSLPLMNMGDAALRHVLVTFDIPGFAEGQSVLVGEIPRDESRTAKAALTPGQDTLGQVKGTVSVRYEDAYGEAGSFSLPFETTVEKKPAPPPPPESLQQESPSSGLMGLLPWGLAGLLLLGLIMQTLLSKRRIRRLEEEAL